MPDKGKSPSGKVVKKKSPDEKAKLRVVNIGGKPTKVRIVAGSKSGQRLSKEDLDMDTRVASAVKSAVSKAKVCHKPIAKYDVKTKRAYLEYPSGAKRYVK